MKSSLQILAGLIVIAIIVTMVTGCSGNIQVGGTQMANPMKAVSYGEMVETVGIPLNTPQGAKDVCYYTITGESAVIEEMVFTLNGREYACRASATEMDVTRLSGVWFTNGAAKTTPVAFLKGTLFTQGKTGVLYWDDRVPGICYSVFCADCDDPAALTAIAEDIFVPMQEETPGDPEGLWLNNAGEIIELTTAGKSTYDASVNIVRLARFVGYGQHDTGRMTLTLEDPSGGILYADFYDAGDGTRTLSVTESTWSLLETGSEFTGFTRAA